MECLTPRARRLLERGADLGVGLTLLVGAMLPVFSARAADAPPALINEAVIHHVGDDTTEFVELYGTPGGPLGGLSLVAVEGDGTAAGTLDLRVDLPSTARLGGNGYFLIGNPAGLAAHYGVVPDLAMSAPPGMEAVGFLENGSQTLALVRTEGLGPPDTHLSGGEAPVDAVGFWDGGSSDAWFLDAPRLDLWDGFLPPGAHRLVDGQDTDTAADWAFADYVLGPDNTPTAATPFDAPPVVTCGPDLAGTAGAALSTPVSAADPDGRIVSFSREVSPPAASITLGPTSPSAGAGELATTSVEVGEATEDGSYVVTVTAWTDDPTPHQASCAVTVTLAPAPPAPPPSPSVGALAEMVDEMVDPSKAHILLERLDRVQRMLDAGQLAAAAAQLRALANQVTGMSPTWLSTDAADALKSMAAALGDSLGSS